MTIEQNLDRIAELEDMIANVSEKAEQQKRELMPDDVRIAFDVIDEQVDEAVTAAANEIEFLKEATKAEVMLVGKTIKSTRYQAVWNKPRVKWDTDKLEGMIALIPAIAEARSFGEPSITFRRVK